MIITKNWRYISFIVIASFLLCPVKSYAGYGDWKVYAAYHHATKVAELNKVLYVLSDNGLYSYDPEDTSIETYDKATGLSDNFIFSIESCPATKQIVIVYSNGNIDLLNSNGEVYNMPELKDKSLNDKTINDIYVNGEDVYISTNSGIVVLNTKKKVFSNFYYFGDQVSSVLITDGYIIAACNGGTYKGKLNDNLLDANNWTKINSEKYVKLFQFGDTYYVLNKYTRLCRVTNNETFNSVRIVNIVITECCKTDDYAFFFTEDEIYYYDKDNNEKKIPSNHFKHFTILNGTYWVAANENGLIGTTFDGNEFKTTVSSIIPNSPIRNQFYKLKMAPNGRLLVAGGAFLFPVVRWDGTIMKYENNEWMSFDEEGPINDVGDYYYKNMVDILQDPDDPEHHFVSAAASGLYEFKNYKYVNHYTYTNSPLRTILPESSHAAFYIRVTGLALDNQKNLWMLNNQCDTIIRIMKPDRSWVAYYIPEIAGAGYTDQVMFDQRGWAWINSRLLLNENTAGLLILNTNGTINRTDDDKYVYLSTFTNQDGTEYSMNHVNCILEDLNGAIWFGTNMGPFVIYDPQNVFNGNVVSSQVKVPRNDGTNYADYLLGEVEVKCMAIDGGNRKWFGTSGSGVFLVSADGTEILEHFTTENSPLISDDIYSIDIDGSSGEVFFGTSNGLASYVGNATDPEEEFNKDLVKVYPNPVRPEYEGNIIVKGLMLNSNVKIVNAAGRLVYEGTSVGGEFTWNGRLSNGKKVSSGVYYVLCTDEEGEKGVATKFLVVR